MKQESVVTSIWDNHTANQSGVGRDICPPPLPAQCNLPADKICYSSPPPISKPVNSERTTLSQLLVDVAIVSQSHSRARRSRKNLRSTGWLSSILLHIGVVLLLALILVPADYGGMNAISFFASIDQQSSQENLVFIEREFSEAPQMPEEAPHILPTLFPGQILAGSKSTSASPHQTSGPWGSFFGINAYGHEFVYVLDMSNSMEGQRFDRACAELMRSVEQLGPNQKFYVMLFCNQTRQMFDQSDYLPQPIDATPENKERLANWLRTTTLGGGTDPREALEVAMRMNPSAIFMLSDGEFNGRTQQKQEKLLGGNGDAFSIVAAAPTKPPINAIAFEDMKSQENMRRLSEVTAGQFRFVDKKEGASPEESIKCVCTAVQQGDLAMAELYIREAVANFTDTKGGMQAKIEIAKVLFELAENGLKKDEFSAARLALVDYAHIYPNAKIIEEYRTKLVENLLDRLKSDRDVAAVTSLLTEFAKGSPKSATAKRVFDLLSRDYLDEAKELYDKREYLASIQKLEAGIATFPKWTAVSECRSERDRIAKELLDESEKLRQQQGYTSSARHLRRLATVSEGTQFHAEVIQKLETQVKEMLVVLRDANYANDWTTRDSIQQEFEAGFGDDPLLIRVRQDFVQKEQAAQELFQRAIKVEKPSQIRTAVGFYRRIVTDYSGTRAAQMANERMRMLGQRPGN